MNVQWNRLMNATLTQTVQTLKDHIIVCAKVDSLVMEKIVQVGMSPKFLSVREDC